MMQLPDEELEELFTALQTAAHEYGVAKAKRIGLEDQRKVTKNQLMLTAEAEGQRSRDKQERFAYTHPQYRHIVDKLVAAIEAEVDAEYACKIIEMRWESWRSIGANMRASRT